MDGKAQPKWHLQHLTHSCVSHCLHALYSMLAIHPDYFTYVCHIRCPHGLVFLMVKFCEISDNSGCHMPCEVSQAAHA